MRDIKLPCHFKVNKKERDDALINLDIWAGWGDAVLSMILRKVREVFFSVKNWRKSFNFNIYSLDSARGCGARWAFDNCFPRDNVNHAKIDEFQAYWMKTELVDKRWDQRDLSNPPDVIKLFKVLKNSEEPHRPLKNKTYCLIAHRHPSYRSRVL